MRNLAKPLALLAALAALAPAHADRDYHVTLISSALNGHPAGPFSLDFQFIDGDGLVDNAITLTNFDFGGGSASGLPTLTGSAAGDLSAGVSLNDSAFFNEFTQSFIPGNFLAFDLHLSENFAGGIPDSLSFAVLDSTLVEIPTQSAFNVFFQVDLDGAPPTISTFASNTLTSPAAGGPALDIPAPTFVELSGSSAPEPSSVVLVAFIGLQAGVVGWRRKKV